MELNQITGILVEVLRTDPSKVEPSSHLVDDLGADSLDLTQIWMMIEETFNIEISAVQMEQPETVLEMAELVARLTKPSEKKKTKG